MSGSPRPAASCRQADSRRFSACSRAARAWMASTRAWSGLAQAQPGHLDGIDLGRQGGEGARYRVSPLGDEEGEIALAYVRAQVDLGAAQGQLGVVDVGLGRRASQLQLAAGLDGLLDEA